MEAMATPDSLGKRRVATSARASMRVRAEMAAPEALVGQGVVVQGAFQSAYFGKGINPH